MADVPGTARVVVIGGGAVGTSVLYHLALKGWTDCVLLERNELTSGSTWHAAGNCPNASGSWSILRLQHYSTELYARLGETVDYPMNYHVTGSVRLAQSRDRMEEFHHMASMARLNGIGFEVLTPEELKAVYPFVELHGLHGALWDPTDGDIDPAQLTQAYAKGARDLGAEVIRFCEVTGLEERRGGGWDVITNKGRITCEAVVNAAGYRAAELGRLVGRDVPCAVMSHQYLVTEGLAEIAERDAELPLLRDPDDSYYLRQERDGLLLGPYEWQATAHWQDGLPADFSFELFPDDLERLEWYIEQACARVPLLGSVGVQRVVNGPIPYTPDGNPLIGPAPGLRNFYECCVFSFGIVQSGGAGKLLSDWIVEGEPEWDIWALDPRRYTGYVTKSYTTAKAIELYQNEYAIGYPFEERPAGRPAKTSPLYEKLKAKGAMFGARGGWERAAWFPRPQDTAEEQLSFHHTNWFDAVGEECRAVAEAVGILDLTGFARFEIAGPGAAAWLDGMIAGNLPKVGRVGLAYFCLPSGKILTEMTLTRLAEDRFWALGAAAAEWHDRDWLAAHLPDDGSVTLTNCTARYGTLVLTGPLSRDLLAAVTDTDLSSKAFPWMSARAIEIGTARLWALRVSYAGELGWELHVPMESLVTVYDRLWDEGEAFGLRDFGLYAMESLRLEKCYRSWKQDFDSDYSPLRAALDRFVKLDKPDFIGREALLREKQSGTVDRFVPLLVSEGDVDAPFCSTIWRNGEAVGLVTSGGYGHRVKSSIALGYVRCDLANEGEELEIDILGERRRARVASEPLYDPANERLRG